MRTLEVVKIIKVKANSKPRCRRHFSTILRNKFVFTCMTSWSEVQLKKQWRTGMCKKPTMTDNIMLENCTTLCFPFAQYSSDWGQQQQQQQTPWGVFLDLLAVAWLICLCPKENGRVAGVAGVAARNHHYLIAPALCYSSTGSGGASMPCTIIAKRS